MPLLRIWLDTIRSEVLAIRRGGFVTSDVIEPRTTKHFEGRVDPKELALALPDILAETAEMLAAEQETWPARTDCDRLDAVFDELNSRGILARHHCPWTFADARLILSQQIVQLEGRQGGVPIKGMVFYDQEATEEAAAGRALVLECIAASNGGDEADLVQEVIAVLAEHGLQSHSHGHALGCLFVLLDWKRRNPPERWIGQ